MNDEPASDGTIRAKWDEIAGIVNRLAELVADPVDAEAEHLAVIPTLA